MKNIIYLDDNPNDHELFRNTLKIIPVRSLRVTQIYTTQELIIQLRHEKFDVVFMDFMMFPDMDIVYEQIYGQVKAGSIDYRFVIVSGAEEEYIRKRVLGFHGYINKTNLKEGLMKYLS